MSNPEINLLDVPFVISTSYTKFIITSIEIEFGLPAIVRVQLLQDDLGLNSIFKIIEIPANVYENWQFDKIQIINYVNTQLSL
jgi:hypothetical protein